MSSTQNLPTAATARQQYQSAIAAEYRSAVQRLDEEGVEALLDWGFAEVLIPHLNGSHDSVFSTSDLIAAAVEDALNKHYAGTAAIEVRSALGRGFSEKRVLVKVTPQEHAFTQAHKEVLWHVLTNLVEGKSSAGVSASISLFTGYSGWLVNPTSRNWINEAFEEYIG